MKQRVRYFDIAKAIAMIGVVLGHSILIVNALTPVSPLMLKFYAFIFTFHMPLFFILSGYFMHPEHEFAWKKKATELLATYALTCLAIIAGNVIVAGIRHTGMRAAFANWAAAAYYGAGDFSPHYLWPVPMRVGALWFLLALFWAQLFLHAVKRLPFTPVWGIVLFLVGYYSARIFWLPLSVQSGMTATAFLYIGYLFKQYDVIAFIEKYWLLWIPIIAAWALFFWRFTGFSMAMNEYGHPWILAAAGSTCATLVIVGISQIIDKFGGIFATALSKMGTYTLAILCAHLLEDDVTPWTAFLPQLNSTVGTTHSVIIVFVCRAILDAVICVIIYNIPQLNTIFYPSLLHSVTAHKRHKAPAQTQATAN